MPCKTRATLGRPQGHTKATRDPGFRGNIPTYFAKGEWFPRQGKSNRTEKTPW